MIISIKDAIEELKIQKVPEDFLKNCDTPPTVSICDRGVIDFLEEDYGLLGKFKSPLLECLSMVEASPALLTYGNAAASYMIRATSDEAKKIPIPIADEDTVMRFYPLLILCAMFPSAIEKYRRRDFSEDEICEILTPTVENRVALCEEHSQKIGMDAAGYNWLRLYALAEIFPAGIFNITPKHFERGVIVLKNKHTDKLAILFTEGEFHNTGMVLGSAGFEDCTDSFSADFKETDTAYMGRVIRDSLVSRDTAEYKKCDWEILLSEGDGFAGVHIPRGADLSADKITESFKLALEKTRRHYPELSAKAVCCSSWMLDPSLVEILGEKSKIAGFVNSFVKYPRKSAETNIFGFVFPKIFDSYESLPEETSLQRKLKERYLRGEYIHAFSGIVPNIY